MFNTSLCKISFIDKGKPSSPAKGYDQHHIFFTLSLGSVSLVSNLTYIWAIGALILVRYFKLNIIWIFLLGIVAEISLYSLGVSL